MDTKVHKASKGDKKYKEYHEKSIPVKWIKAHQVRLRDYQQIVDKWNDRLGESK